MVTLDFPSSLRLLLGSRLAAHVSDLPDMGLTDLDLKRVVVLATEAFLRDSGYSKLVGGVL